jgi:hypothetical protein
MKTSLKTLVAGTMATVIVAFAAVAPASAGPWWPHPHYGYGWGYGHGYGWGYGHGWGYGRGYGWGPVAAAGVFGLAAGAAIASENPGCIRYQPMYDNWGNYIGQRAVNVCY